MSSPTASRPESKQALYDQIRQTSRDEVILKEMIRLGFWKQDLDKPSVPEALIQRKAEINKRMKELLKKQTLFMDREKALAEIHRIRKEESKKRRQELKEERLAKAQEKKRRWKELESTCILYLGESYSHQLGDFTSQPQKLADYGLQDYPSHLALAEHMGISLRELKFLCFSRDVSAVSHYKRFAIPKKSGGERVISAPQDRLKTQQYWVYETLLKPLPLHSAAHGFAPSKSILTNAAPHLQADTVINLDLKDFFPSVSYARVLGVFKGLGYSPAIATVLALLTTEQPSREVELDGKKWFVSDGERALPQGAPTSPVLTNWLCRRLDSRMKGISDKLGFVYTRYADDMTFSLPQGVEEDKRSGLISQLLWHVKKVISEEGFTLHPDKLRIMRTGERKEVTGIVVNEKPSVSRQKVKAFRALLHRLQTKGVEGATWDNSSERVIARALGYAHFLVMVDKARFSPMLQQMESIAEQYDFTPEIRHPRRPQNPNCAPCEALTAEEIEDQVAQEEPSLQPPSGQKALEKTPKTQPKQTEAPSVEDSLQRVKSTTTHLLLSQIVQFIGATCNTLGFLAFFFFDSLHPYRWPLLLGGWAILALGGGYSKWLARRLEDQ